MDSVWKRHKLIGTVRQPTDGRWKPSRSSGFPLSLCLDRLFGPSYCYQVHFLCWHFIRKAVVTVRVQKGCRHVTSWFYLHWHEVCCKLNALSYIQFPRDWQYTARLLNRPFVAWFDCANRNYIYYRAASGDMLYGEITAPFLYRFAVQTF